MKTAVITGTSRGIGKATAEKFLNEGYNVIGCSRTANNIESKNFTHIDLDLAVGESVIEATSRIIKNVNTIDVLVNNGAVLLDSSTDIIDIQVLRKTLDINLIGTIDFTNHLLSAISSTGYIVNVSSMAAGLIAQTAPGWNYMSYKISKCALNMYTKTLGDVMKDKGVVVASLDPGWVQTEMGGKEASRKPSEAAQDIFDLVQKPRETGKFWLNGKQRPW